MTGRAAPAGTDTGTADASPRPAARATPRPHPSLRPSLRPALLLALLLAAPAAAQVVPESYAVLARELDGRIGFETLPQRPEPGFRLDAPLREPGAWIGESFRGREPAPRPGGGDGPETPPRHDRIAGRPEAPLRIRAGAPGRNLSVAFHRGFGSNALFPLGPAGFPALEARGEGAAAILFDRDQAAVGLKLHSDYPDPLGTRARPGEAILRLYTRQGRLIARIRIPLRPGINPVGLRRAGNVPDIAGIEITNTDPGGVAIDDILFQLVALTG